MPLKLNVGLSKKIGLPDYGSAGASCHVELELDSTVLQYDLDVFHQQVRDAYVACHQAVEDELAHHRHQTQPGRLPTAEPPIARTAASDSGNAHNGNGRPVARNGDSDNGHAASEKQITYLNQLARQIRELGVRRLDDLARQMFGKPLAEVNSLEASSLIDTLKAIKSGEINMDSLLGAGVAS